MFVVFGKSGWCFCFRLFSASLVSIYHLISQVLLCARINSKRNKFNSTPPFLCSIFLSGGAVPNPHVLYNAMDNGGLVRTYQVPISIHDNDNNGSEATGILSLEFHIFVSRVK